MPRGAIAKRANDGNGGVAPPGTVADINPTPNTIALRDPTGAISATAFLRNPAAAVAGVGNSLIVSAQGGFAGSNGGTLTIGGGPPGTAGANLAGNTRINLGAVNGIGDSARLQFLVTGFSELDMYHSGVSGVFAIDCGVSFEVFSSGSTADFLSLANYVNIQAFTDIYLTAPGGDIRIWGTVERLRISTGAALAITADAAETSVTYGQGQDPAAAGATTTLRAQQGAAGFAGGILALGGGLGGTPGADLSGNTTIDLGATVGGASAQCRFLIGGTSYLNIRLSGVSGVFYLECPTGSAEFFATTNTVGVLSLASYANIQAATDVYLTASTAGAGSGIRFYFGGTQIAYFAPTTAQLHLGGDADVVNVNLRINGLVNAAAVLGAAGALPALPAGYVAVNVNGAVQNVPFYN